MNNISINSDSDNNNKIHSGYLSSMVCGKQAGTYLRIPEAVAFIKRVSNSSGSTPGTGYSSPRPAVYSIQKRLKPYKFSSQHFSNNHLPSTNNNSETTSNNDNLNPSTTSWNIHDSSSQSSLTSREASNNPHRLNSHATSFNNICQINSQISNARQNLSLDRGGMTPERNINLLARSNVSLMQHQQHHNQNHNHLPMSNNSTNSSTRISAFSAPKVNLNLFTKRSHVSQDEKQEFFDCYSGSYIPPHSSAHSTQSTYNLLQQTPTTSSQGTSSTALRSSVTAKRVLDRLTALSSSPSTSMNAIVNNNNISSSSSNLNPINYQQIPQPQPSESPMKQQTQQKHFALGVQPKNRAGSHMRTSSLKSFNQHTRTSSQENPAVNSSIQNSSNFQSKNTRHNPFLNQSFRGSNDSFSVDIFKRKGVLFQEIIDPTSNQEQPSTSEENSNNTIFVPPEKVSSQKLIQKQYIQLKNNSQHLPRSPSIDPLLKQTPINVLIPVDTTTNTSTLTQTRQQQQIKQIISPSPSALPTPSSVVLSNPSNLRNGFHKIYASQFFSNAASGDFLSRLYPDQPLNSNHHNPETISESQLPSNKLTNNQYNNPNNRISRNRKHLNSSDQLKKYRFDSSKINFDIKGSNSNTNNSNIIIANNIRKPLNYNNIQEEQKYESDATQKPTQNFEITKMQQLLPILKSSAKASQQPIQLRTACFNIATVPATITTAPQNNTNQTCNPQTPREVKLEKKSTSNHSANNFTFYNKSFLA